MQSVCTKSNLTECKESFQRLLSNSLLNLNLLNVHVKHSATVWTSGVLRFLKCSLEAYEFQGCISLASLSEVLHNPTVSQYSKQRDFGQGSLKAKGVTVLKLSGNISLG